MANGRVNTYMGTVPVFNGNLIDNGELTSARFYMTTLNDNRKNPSRRWVLRYRYRGPRRPGYLGKSMCLKNDATSADIYLYSEIVYNH